MNQEPDYITIVSGLPRSGTSMLMRMLDAGGLPVLVDDLRQSDAHNPRGYYEYAPVKRLRQDQSWLVQARGKAVKVIYLLLHALPAHFQYRIVFMRREMSEILESQRKMLATTGQTVAHASPADDRRVARLFEQQLAELDQWLIRQPNIGLLYADYNAMMRDCHDTCLEIAEFLDGRVTLDAMRAVLEPDLYRNRS